MRGRLFRQPAPQRFQPFEFVGEFLRARRLAVGYVEIDHPVAANGGGEYPSRRVVEVRDVADEVRHRRARQQRDSVVGFLAAEYAVIPRGGELRMRKVRVLHLGLLQCNDVGSDLGQPLHELFAAHPQRIDVPGGDREGVATTGGGVHPPRPCWRSSALTSGGRPRKSTKASSALRLPPCERIESRKRCATARSNTPRSSKAAKASAASTSAHL